MGPFSIFCCFKIHLYLGKSNVLVVKNVPLLERRECHESWHRCLSAVMDNHSLICQNAHQVWDFLSRMLVTFGDLEQGSFHCVEHHAQNLQEHL